MRALLLSGISFWLLSCTQYVSPIALSEADPYQRTPVFFVTNRNDTGSPDLNRRFGSERSETLWGLNEVAIPHDYPRRLKANSVHWYAPIRRDPEKHLSLVDTRRLNERQFWTALEVADKPSPTNPRLVFIPGYNTSFERASRVAAKLAYDLHVSTPPLLFSWPSQDAATGYTADESSLAWSQPYLNALLLDLLQNASNDSQVLLAHSMGNRALVRALAFLADSAPETLPAIKAVVLVAPDIDRAIFARDWAPKLASLGQPVTLYVSERDLALQASHTLHRYPRAGHSEPEPLVLPGIDTVDVSLAESEILGHEYFSQGAHTITDLYQWLIEGRSPESRSQLKPRIIDAGRYWQLQPTPES